ncbi:phosphate ABC transporter, phosphate-binding protein PstS [Acinetobacter nectaris CIP 110549]|uniref:Phosphate-binding protein PstS n=1 Tax=Acinetobacter nectaris CIP 110549 TaxID=1392540 RepID=V2TLK9_9GAMM|nr:phosphate ABC transporter substrate-binding protein PstS [Acinetobacter nectaris]ESK38681.1 phosphate ABC transporter, phosphate-binding protein PstS [Acinetobacter nectaris CIP 110549]
MAYRTKRLFKSSLLALLAPLALSVSVAQAAEITGAGSTFVYPVLSKWSAAYNTKTGNKVNYQSIGSGGGIAQIKAGTVTFGASDMPLTPQELNTAGLKQFPVIVGGVVPVVNIDGIAPGSLHLTGAVLADIFLGKITKWNDPEVQKLNPSLKLPDQRVSVVHRSDGSGTTFNWANYLSKVSPTWKSKAGEGTSISWPTGVGGKGNEGVAAYVKQIKGSIGYVELAYALQNKMSYTALQNKAGKFVQPSTASFQAAAAGTNWNQNPDFYNIITNAPGENSWPITATTFVIMHKVPKSANESREALNFFKWSLENGQADAKALDYIPLPSNLVKEIEGYWSKNIK